MGFGIMYYEGTARKKMYCTNTNMLGYFSEDIENAAKIVQKKNAEAAVLTMYRNGFKEQLYVVEIIHVPARFYEVPMLPEKEGWVIVDPLMYRGEYYTAAKKPSTFRTTGFGVKERASTFKTEKEAQKCLDAVLVLIDEDIEYYRKVLDRRPTEAQRYIDIYTDFKENLEIKKL